MVNFRPTKGKVIGSLIVTALFFIAIIIYFNNLMKGVVSQEIGNVRNILQIIDLAHPLNFGNIILYLIVFVIVYIIYSIFQRKENRI